MQPQVQLGFDIGGTASRWVACDSAGSVLARGEAGGASGRVFEPVERDRLSGAIQHVARALAEQGLTVERATAGLTGFGPSAAEDVRAILAQPLGIPPASVVALDDMTLGYLEQFAPGEGHLVSAGTGAFGLHIAADGSRVRVGGRGMLIDDAGSGAWIALRALDHIYRGYDRHASFGADSVLAEELLGAIGGSNWDDVRQYVYGGDRGRIGVLSVAVARAATRGDAAAAAILRAAGTELARLATALIGRTRSLPVVLVGRVLDLHLMVREQVGRILAAEAVHVRRSDAALAAARLQANTLDVAFQA
jgi:N-acetylglucosamine kinase-like BadF-type ATPase